MTAVVPSSCRRLQLTKDPLLHVCSKKERVCACVFFMDPFTHCVFTLLHASSETSPADCTDTRA